MRVTREALLEPLADRGPRQLQCTPNGGYRLILVPDDVTRDAVIDHLSGRTLVVNDDRRAARHGFDHH